MWKKFIRKGIFVFLIVVLVWNITAVEKKETEKNSFSIANYLAENIQTKVMETVLPFASFQTEYKKDGQENLLETMALQQMPLFVYAKEHGANEEIVEDSYFYELLLEEQGQQSSTVNAQPTEDENTDDILAGMEAENAAAKEEFAEIESEQEETAAEEQNEVSGELTNEAVNMQSGTGFQKVMEKQREYDWNLFSDSESLVKEFYAVDSTTSAAAADINLDNLLKKDLSINKNTEGYQILIFHTHSQEGFADSVPGDDSTTIVGAGDRLAEILTDEYGYKVLHHTGEYDVESRDDAYSKALPAIEQILKENPGIQVVIDLHRDEVAEGTKLVTEIQGRPTAKFMFFNGLSYTNRTGKIDYLLNENLDSNLAFSFQMQVACNEYFPGLTRRIYLKGYRYNMHLKERFLLVELGAQTNTVEEIKNACDPLAQTLDMVLSDMVY